MQGVWVERLHVNEPPPEHVPLAPFAPHPVHKLPTWRTWGSVHTSLVVPQLPAVVLHPPPAVQPATQHSFPAPVTQSTGVGLQVQEAQVPAPSHVRVQVAG